MDYTDYQQRALYGAGQAAARAGQRFHMEREALERGDKDAAKYHRSRANNLNRAGAYAAVRGMGGNEGKNQYFPVQSSGQPIYSTNFPGQFALSSQGKEVFDQFRDSGFIEPIRQKKRYAPNTSPKGLGWLMEKALENTMMGRAASQILPKKTPEPDDAYYKSLWGKGLNEMYSPSGIFSSGKFLGTPQIDPYYRKNYKGPEFLRGLLEPFHKPRGDAFGVVRDSSIPEDWEFMQETPMDYTPLLEQPSVEEVDETIVDTPIDANETGNWWYTPPPGDDVSIMYLPEIYDYDPFDEDSFNSEYEFVNKEYGDRESDDWQGVSTPWEYFTQMHGLMDHLSNEEMAHYLIESDVIQKKYSDKE